MATHLVRDIDNLHRSLLNMCAKVEEMIHKAVHELAEPDPAIVERLIEQDSEIDQLDVEIEDDCLKVLALNQPVATDLRRIATVMKIASELERIADLAIHVAERANCLVTLIKTPLPDELNHMVKIAIQMLHQSIDAYVNLDSKAARKICLEDDRVDELNRLIIEKLVKKMKESPEQVDASLHLFSATRHIERIADHATNIAEDVIYLVEGEIVRHSSRSQTSQNNME